MRREFARQAEAYARSPSISRPDLVEWLVRLTEARPGERVLDVACGPGHVTLAFVRRGCHVTGVDLTPETLRIARRRLGEARQAGEAWEARPEALRTAQRPTPAPGAPASPALVCGHATALPFGDGSFDLCVCRSAFHHFPEPAAALREMARVTRPGGRVATLDHVTSEETREAAWHDRIERLRDPSHASCLSPGAWRSLYREAGLTPNGEESASFPFDFDEWFDRAFQGESVKREVSALLLAHPAGGVPGFRLLKRAPLTLQFDFLAFSAPVR